MADLNTLCLLTTRDNPYNPFVDWDKWYVFDMAHGYNTCGLLARITSATDVVDDGESIAAMSEIIRVNPWGVHEIVTPDSYEQHQNQRTKVSSS